jgi:hypothetical protein
VGAPTPPPAVPAARLLRGVAVFAVASTVAAVGAYRASWYRDDVATTTQLLVSGKGLYHCKNGYPDVPRAYARSWGNLTGDWYVVMEDPSSQASEFKCDRMVFDLFKDGDRLRQSMLYTRKNTDYWWNITQDEYKHRTGVWKDTSNEFWSSVFAVGTTDSGSRWVGWYFCGPAVSATKKGMSFIMKDSTHGLTKSFYRDARAAARDAGVLDYGDLAEVDIEASCDYTFPDAGV